jgi:uncharacterized membrane protein (UPF0127 family)
MPRPVLHAFAIASLLAPTACNADTAAAPATDTAPATRPADPPPIRFDSLALIIKGKEHTLEVAVTEAQHQRGLMYRDSMAHDHGMLFVFDSPRTLKFWMRNTRIPLDMIFLDRDGRVVDVLHAKPLDETSIGPDAPTQFVIELNANAADKLGLKKGDRIDLPAKYLKN